MAAGYRRIKPRQVEAMPGDVEGTSRERDALDVLVDAERRALVLSALDRMPLERRAVFVMHEIDEHSIPDVARALDLPLNTAYSRLRIAREEFAAAVRRLQGAEK